MSPTLYPASPYQTWLKRRGAVGAGLEARAVLELEGCSRQDLLHAMEEVVARHDALRSALDAVPYPPFVVQSVAESASALEVEVTEPAPGRHLVTLRGPAAVVDARSFAVIARELAATLGGGELDPDPVQFAEFAEWRNEVSGHSQPPAGEPAVPTRSDFTVHRAEHRLGPEAAGDLADLACAAGVPTRDVLLTAWMAFHPPLGGDEVCTVAVADDGREADPELRDVFGAATAYLRVSAAMPPELSFTAAIRRVAEALRRATAAGDGALGEAAGDVPAFDVAGGSQRFPAGRVTVTLRTADARTEPFARRLTWQEDDATLAVEVDAAAAPVVAAERVADGLAALLAAAGRYPATKLADLPLVGPDELAWLSEVSRGPQQPAPATPLASILAAARAHPDRVALRDGHTRLTYAELVDRAAGVAAALAGRGVKHGDRVVVLADRTVWPLIAIVGVMLTGGAYVPLDEGVPAGRFRTIVEDCGAQVVLTRLTLELPEGVARLDPSAAPQATAPCGATRTLADAAYVLYTSGSTGQPKGVVITDGGLANYCAWAVERYGLAGPGDALVTSPFGFDLSVTTAVAPLTVGGTVAVAPNTNPLDVRDAIDPERGVTALKITPRHLELLTAELAGSALGGAVGTVVVGGEPLPRSAVDRWRKLSTGSLVVNEYGPTETVVGSAWHAVAGDGGGQADVPIGRPIANTALHVLDSGLRPVPTGAVGELFIAGAGVAQGYQGAPAQTAARFLPDPFAGGGARMYRTGDLVRRDHAGDLWFLGRADDQLKIRGFRVEPGEVEQVLAGVAGVRAAVVVPSGQALVGFVVRDGGPEGDDDLLRHAATLLPDHMVPARLVRVPELPLTANGKVDRTQLARNVRPRPEAMSGPRTELEQSIDAVWRRVLGLDFLGLDESFFEVGGDSLLAIEAVRQLQDRLERPLRVVTLFEHPTVRRLAAHLAGPAGGDGYAAAAGAARRPAQDSHPTRPEPAVIAVVGMAVRAPAAPTVDAMWQQVAAGRNCIERFPDDGTELSRVDRTLLTHGTRVMAGGVLGDVDKFDADYFGLSPLDAAILDPQQRVFLELVRHALDDAAAPASRRESTAVYAGCAMSSYLQHNLLEDLALLERVGAYALTVGNDKDFLATRVSHKFGFGGPSMTIQTACSTSLVAVHVAASSLLAGECDTAIAGGVSIRVPERRGYLYQPDGIMAVDGVCRPFDAAASGFVPSNGAVAIVMRRLSDAIADGDPIRAVLLATAVNNDGANRPGFTAPGVEGQVRVLSEALALSGLAPGDVTFAETHGTATALGDVVEFEALQRVYGDGPDPCWLGASKANFGHTDTAAGALGLAKAVLALQRRQIPPLANFEAPNPRLDIAGSRFSIPTELADWERNGRPRRAAVTSLGLGGTNAHVIVEEAPAPGAAASRPDRAAAFLPVSAHSAAAAQTRAEDIAQATTADPGRAPGMARTLAEERQLPYRMSLEAAAPPRVPARRVLADRVSVVLAFPGGGAQHPGMATDLVAAEPVFAAALEEALAAVEPLAGAAVRAALLHPEQTTAADLWRTSVGLPALFCVQLATWRLLESWGVRPSALIGHSAGEYAAACVAGVLEPAEAARLVVTRAQLFETAPPGAMIGLLLPEEEVTGHLAVAPGLEIAAVNGAEDTVVGGPLASIAALRAHLEVQGLPWQRVPVDVAAHTTAVSGVAEALEQVAAEIPVRAPTVPWVSTLTGTWIGGTEMGARYWGTHLRQTVRFADGVRSALAQPGTVMLDVGPGQVLKGMVERDGLPDGVVALAALPHHRSDEPASRHARRAMVELWTAGVAIDPTAPDGPAAASRVALPPYPFEHTRHWIGEVRPAGVGGLRHRFYEEGLDEVGPLDAARAAPDGGWLVADDGSEFAAAVIGKLRVAGFTVVASGMPWPPVDGAVRGAIVVAGRDPTAAYHLVADAARALAAMGPGPLELVSVTDADDPVSGLSAALVRVIRNEFPAVRARTVEVELGENGLRLLAPEIAGAGVDVVLRGGRFVRSLKPLPVEAAAPKLRERGVWLVTGGLGALGRTLAVHLAQTAEARLVLVARTREGSAPEEAPLRQEALEAITAAGGRYEVVLGDIADPEVAAEAVRRAEEAFGGLDGVIHAAGLPAGGMIELRSGEEVEEVLRPKLGGLAALDAVIGERELDAFVLCSALDAVLGTPGQAEHCAANGYLDAFAVLRARPGLRMISIGWSAWQQIGQAARAVVPDALRSWREEMLATALRPEDGCVVFDEALAAARPHVLVSADDPAALQRLAARSILLATGGRTDSVLDESLTTPVERRVAELWIDVLAAPVVRAHDDFFALGGHSLAAMQLVSRLRETFEVPVKLPELIERSVLRDQAALVEELLVEVVEQLDDEEVLRRLYALASLDAGPDA